MFEKTFLCTSEAEIRTLLAAGPLKKRLPQKPKHSSPANGIAVVQIRGTLTKYGSDFGPSMIDVAWQIPAAAEDPNIATIVLWCDSGGGEVAGSFEVAATVAAAAKRKTVIGLAEDITASGAFLILSQCTKLYATNRLTMIGSIGVLLVILDTSAMFEQLGWKMIRVRSGDLKGIGTPGLELSEAETKYLQSIVQFTAGEFSMAVSRGRGLPPDTVRGLATGEVFPAPTALRLGLIDGIKTLAEIIIESNGPLMTLATDAQRFTALVNIRLEAGFDEIEATDYAETSEPKLAKQHATFHAMPKWQRDELDSLVSKRTTT